MPVDALALAGGVALAPDEYRRIAAVDLMQGDANIFSARGGLHPGGGPRVTNTGMTLNILDFKGVVYVPSPPSVGPYRVAMLSHTKTIPTADSVNARKDIVYLRVFDDLVDGDGLYQADTVYLAGTPSGSPVEPTVPALKQVVKLATITVPANSTTPTVDYNALYTVSNGGILPVRNVGERPTAGLYAGLLIYQIDTGILYAHNGSTWIALGEPVTTTSTISSATDWSVTWDAWRHQGGFVIGSLNFTRTGSTLTPTNTGNHTPDISVGTVPSGWRPAQTWSVSGGNGGSGPWEFSVNSAGAIALRSGPPTPASIASTDSVLRVGVAWKLP